MFEVYIQEQSIDPRLRNRMMAALTSAAALTTCAGFLGWVAGELDIDMVSAPKRFEVATLSLEPEPPPPPPPPDQPVRTAAVADTTPAHGRAAKQPEEDRPDAFLEPTTPKARVYSPHGDGPGDGSETAPRNRIPTDGGGGGSPCLVGMSCTGTIATGRVIGERDDAAVTKVDFASMKSIYTPDPAQDELARTRTGLGSRRPGSVRVEFCIDARGKVSRTRVVKRFPGDDAIDAIARRTVTKWRFKPMMVGSQPRAACSAVTFDIRFD